MIDIPQKQCNLCKSYYPATVEFFHRQGMQNGAVRLNNECKTCRSMQRHLQIREDNLPVNHRASAFSGEEDNVERKRCTDCNNDYPATPEFFYYTDKQKSKFKSYCKSCTNRRDRERVSLRKQQIVSITVKQVMGTPDQCGCCGAENVNILGDVDDETREQYGYLCFRCHKLIGSFHADPARIKKALCYIEKTRKGHV